MDPYSGRIMVMQPELAGTALVEECSGDPPKREIEIIAGHDVFLYVARGEGTYHANGRGGVLRPNTLIATPAGTFSCAMSADREIYVLSVRERRERLDDLNTFTPSLEYHMSPAEGRRWRERMAGYVERSAAGRFDFDDVGEVKREALPYVWRQREHAVRETLEAVLSSVWTRLDDELRLDALANETGYTANYLNDLSREHTGRPIGRWIADMRMARSRAALEQTDIPIADVGAASGYEDPAYFARAFRRAHGVPPSTWRIASRPVDPRHSDLTIDMGAVAHGEVYRKTARRIYSYAS